MKIFGPNLLSYLGAIFLPIITSPFVDKNEFLGLKRHYERRGRKFYAPKSFRHLEAKIDFSTETFFWQVGMKIFPPKLTLPPRGDFFRPQNISLHGDKINFFS